MDLTEKRVNSNYIFHGKIMTVRVDDALLPNGEPCIREVCEHPGGVGVLPIDENRMVTLCASIAIRMQRQRWKFRRERWIAVRKTRKRQAGRELSEETGLTAGQMISMGEIWPSPGFMDERLYLYCAKELAQGACHPDADEFVEIVRMPFEELCQRVASGEIHDAKTVAAVGKMLIMGL